MAIIGMETQGRTRQEAEKKTMETVRLALRQIFEMAAEEHMTTDAAACRIVEERLKGAKTAP